MMRHSTLAPLQRVLYQCRLPPRTTRTDRWQLYERLECSHLIRVKFDHLGQITTAARRRCAKCANSLPTDLISDAEIETKIVLMKGDAMDEKLSSKFKLGALLAEVLDLEIDLAIELPEALYAALEAQGCRWSGGLWFVLQGYRFEVGALEGYGYFGTIFDPQGKSVHTTIPCGDEDERAHKEAEALVEWFETAAFKAAQVSREIVVQE